MQVRMVSAGIYEELALVCFFFLLGIFLAASYDVLRIFRGLIPHGRLMVNLEDLIYWIYVAIVIFVMLYEKNDGRLRGYVFGGLLVGMIVYGCTFSRICVPPIIAFLRRIFGFLLKPVRKLFRYLHAEGKKGEAFCEKVWTCKKKRLKKMWKLVKIGIYKL